VDSIPALEGHAPIVTAPSTLAARLCYVVPALMPLAPGTPLGPYVVVAPLGVGPPAALAGF
jgi:hypothetical protein